MLLRFAREAYVKLAVVGGRLEIEKHFFAKIKVKSRFLEWKAVLAKRLSAAAS